MPKKRSLEERFWEKVDKTPGHGPNGDCWVWTSNIRTDGYGIFKLSSGKNIAAHRFSYELCLDRIPEGLQVLHKCDSPKCVNPSHLFLGTNQDNMTDKASKGRCNTLKGESSANAKLTTADVIYIKSALADGVTQLELAKRFGVHRGTISKIKRNQCWNHIEVI